MQQSNRSGFGKVRAAFALLATMLLLAGCGGGGGGGSTSTTAGNGGGSGTPGPIGVPSSDWNVVAANQALVTTTKTAQPVRGSQRVPATLSENQWEPVGCPNGSGATAGAWGAWYGDRTGNLGVYCNSFPGTFAPNNPNQAFDPAGVPVFVGSHTSQKPTTEAFDDFSALICAESNEATVGGNMRIAASRLVDNGNGTAARPWGTNGISSISGSSGEQRNPNTVANRARTILNCFYEEQGGSPGLACQQLNKNGLVGTPITLDSGSCRISEVASATASTVVAYDKLVGEWRQSVAAVVNDAGAITTITLSTGIQATLTGVLNTSATITLADTSVLAAGMRVSGTGIQPGSSILSVGSTTQITLTKPTTGSGSQTLTFGGDATFPRIDVVSEQIGVDGNNKPILADFLYAAWPDSRSGVFLPYVGKYALGGTVQWVSGGQPLGTQTIQGGDRGIDVTCHPAGGATYLMEEIVDLHNTSISSVRLNADGTIARGRVVEGSVAQQFTLPSALVDTALQVFGLWSGPNAINFNDFNGAGQGIPATDPLSFAATSAPSARRKIRAVQLGNGRLFTFFEEVRGGFSQVVGRIPHR